VSHTPRFIVQCSPTGGNSGARRDGKSIPTGVNEPQTGPGSQLTENLGWEMGIERLTILETTDLTGHGWHLTADLAVDGTRKRLLTDSELSNHK